MQANVLPELDEPRLKTLGKTLKWNRKLSLIHKDSETNKLNVYVKSLSKAERSLNGKYYLKSQRLKKNLVVARSTQKVLRTKREQTFWEDSDRYPYGIYEGEPLNSYRREIENDIERKNPKYRRQQKVVQVLERGKTSGLLIGDEEAKEQFNEIMELGKRSKTIVRDGTSNNSVMISGQERRQTLTVSQFWKDPLKICKFPFKAKYVSNERLRLDHSDAPVTDKSLDSYRSYNNNSNPESGYDKQTKRLKSPVSTRQISPEMLVDKEKTVRITLPPIDIHGTHDNVKPDKRSKGRGNRKKSRAAKASKAVIDVMKSYG